MSQHLTVHLAAWSVQTHIFYGYKMLSPRSASCTRKWAAGWWCRDIWERNHLRCCQGRRKLAAKRHLVELKAPVASVAVGLPTMRPAGCLCAVLLVSSCLIAFSKRPEGSGLGELLAETSARKPRQSDNSKTEDIVLLLRPRKSGSSKQEDVDESKVSFDQAKDRWVSSTSWWPGACRRPAGGVGSCTW